MAKFVPFRAIRPRADLSKQIVTRSYESYSFKERLTIQAQNPFSFLHVLNPEFGEAIRLRGMKRYRKVREKFCDFLEKGILQQDDNPGFYLYRNTEDELTATGLLGGIAISDYQSGNLKRHEDTISIREKRFADFLEGAQFNAEPVLISYSNHPELDKMMTEIGRTNPNITFLDDRAVKHELWHISDTTRIEQIQNWFSEVEQTYLMDGHHRSASSVLFANRNRTQSDAEIQRHSYFMSCLMPESEIRIGSFSRVLTKLGAISASEIVQQLKANFDVQLVGKALWAPRFRHEFCMYLNNQFYRLEWKGNSTGLSDPDAHLDARILNEYILGPIFGIQDPRNDERLQYIWGTNPAYEIQKSIDSGAFSVGFGMFPIAMSEIKTIADAGKTLPPKSTFIRPKLPSGLTIYKF